MRRFSVKAGYKLAPRASPRPTYTFAGGLRPPAPPGWAFGMGGLESRLGRNGSLCGPRHFESHFAAAFRPGTVFCPSRVRCQP